MLELQLTDLDTMPRLPDLLGPGPSELIAYGARNGLFGTIASNDFITGRRLTSDMKLAEGTDINDGVEWLKFLHHGKVLFIPKKPIRRDITYDTIYNAITNEELYLVKAGGFWFISRLPTGVGPEVESVDGLGHDTPETESSEINELMYYVATDLAGYPKSSQRGDNWANYPQTDVSNGLGYSAGLGPTHWTAGDLVDTSKAVVRGGNSITQIDTRDRSQATGISYRPVLELDTEVRPPLIINVITPQSKPFDDDFLFLAPDQITGVYTPPKIQLP